MMEMRSLHLISVNLGCQSERCVMRQEIEKTITLQYRDAEDHVQMVSAEYEL